MNAIPPERIAAADQRHAAMTECLDKLVAAHRDTTEAGSLIGIANLSMYLAVDGGLNHIGRIALLADMLAIAIDRLARAVQP